MKTEEKIDAIIVILKKITIQVDCLNDHLTPGIREIYEMIKELKKTND